MNENIEARAQELDPSRTRTIGSYVIGILQTTQERLSGRAHSER